MTRPFLITLLVLSSGPAYAEWVLVTHSESRGGYTVYADPDTLRRKGDKMQMWDLYDFHTAGRIGSDPPYFSVKGQREYDCAEQRVRDLEFTFFSGHMGSGNVVARDSTGDKWEPLNPKTIGQTLWKLVCDKE